MMLAAKTPSEVKEYRFKPDIHFEDDLDTVSVAIDGGGITATTEIDADEIVTTVSGGTLGQTARFTVTLTTSEGQTLEYTFDVPVREVPPVRAQTARDVVNFAMRKIVGVHGTATAAEADDALERLNDMLMAWRIAGIETGAAEELELSDTMPVRDEYLHAIKLCLKEELHDFYEVPLSALEYQRVQEAKRAVAIDVLGLAELDFDRALLRRGTYWNFTRGY